MKVLYDTVLHGEYVRRPNRFVVVVNVDGTEMMAHLPNPGRMWELLFPGVRLYLVPHDKPGAKTKYRVVGIERDGRPIMLDTNYSNDVAEHLIEQKLIPGWEEWSVVRREYTVGDSRFDLLLSNAEGKEFLLEVKSCTLFSKNGAMFPDAITERGRKHLLHLKALQAEGYHTGVLFLVQWEAAQWFLPDYHTDIEFAKTFYEVAPDLDWKAVTLRWTADFTMPEVVGICQYDGQVIEREAHDVGDYAVVLHLDETTTVEVGSKGMMVFPAGYYVYVGSAKANLEKRLERHKRKRKQMHWHLDYFRNVCDVIATVPIRTADDLECDLAQAVKETADWNMRGFGCSDCDCKSHLFGFDESRNPIHDKRFMDVIEDFRMNRLDPFIGHVGEIKVITKPKKAVKQQSSVSADGKPVKRRRK